MPTFRTPVRVAAHNYYNSALNFNFHEWTGKETPEENAEIIIEHTKRLSKIILPLMFSGKGSISTNFSFKYALSETRNLCYKFDKWLKRGTHCRQRSSSQKVKIIFKLNGDDTPRIRYSVFDLEKYVNLGKLAKYSIKDNRAQISLALTMLGAHDDAFISKKDDYVNVISSPHRHGILC